MTSEYLKTLQLISRAIFFVSVTIFYISGSTTNSEKYQIAQIEIEELNGIDFSLVPLLIRDTWGDLAQTYAIENYMTRLLEEISSESKIRWISEKNDYPQFQVVPVMNTPDSNASLATIRNYFSAYINGQHIVSLKLPSYDLLKIVLLTRIIHGTA